MQVKYSSWIINCWLNVWVCNIAEHFYSFYFSWFCWRALLKYSAARKNSQLYYTPKRSVKNIFIVQHTNSGEFGIRRLHWTGCKLDPVPTNAFSRCSIFVLSKTHRFLCVYASVFIGLSLRLIAWPPLCLDKNFSPVIHSCFWEIINATW